MTIAPTINSIIDGGDQASAIANVTGAGGVQLYYRKKGAAPWTTGLTRDCSDASIIAYYKMKDNLANKVVHDSSGNGYHGTSIRNTEDMYSAGGGFLFDGVADYITIPNAPALNFGISEVSISLWLKINNFVTEGEDTDTWLFRKGDTTRTHYAVKIIADTKRVLFYFDDLITDDEVVTDEGAAVIGSWIHFVFVRDNSNTKIYKNGVLVASGRSTPTNADNTEPLLIIAKVDLAYIQGYLDDFRIYNKALSAAEVLVLNNALAAGIEEIPSTGDITQTSLEPGWYEFYATDTVDGETSPPSAVITMQIEDVPVVDTAVNEFDKNVIAITPEIITLMGETVVYMPSGGGSRSIVAIIDREGAAAMPAGGYGNSPLTHITVANNSTIGISSAEINTGKDKVELALRRGKLPQARIITKIISQDAGMLTLEVR